MKRKVCLVALLGVAMYLLTGILVIQTKTVESSAGQPRPAIKCERLHISEKQAEEIALWRELWERVREERGADVCNTCIIQGSPCPEGHEDWRASQSRELSSEEEEMILSQTSPCEMCVEEGIPCPLEHRRLE